MPTAVERTAKTFEVCAAFLEPVTEADRVIIGAVVSGETLESAWSYFTILDGSDLLEIFGSKGASIENLAAACVDDLGEFLKTGGRPGDYSPAHSGFWLSHCRMVEAQNQKHAAKVFRECYTLLGRRES